MKSLYRCLQNCAVAGVRYPAGSQGMFHDNPRPNPMDWERIPEPPEQERARRLAAGDPVNAA